MTEMSDPVITVENLGKRFQIGTFEKGADTLRESLMDIAKAPFRRLRSLRGSNASKGEFWAIRNLSFEVQRGDVLGIIGRNGAGKSTLLKLLSRISDPTEGRAVIRGRVASLLEVGTGFHNELSGRENIYLNGAILGMRKAEIDRKFDEIVEFSGVSEFLDTPIKRYSSGMKVRLAFAVAAYLEPEILIIDEVLAVGDADFQAKCMGKMNDVANSGRTVLFVSHNMAAVEGLCTRAIYLEKGRLVSIGPTKDVMTVYLQKGATFADNVDLRTHSGRPSASLSGLQLLQLTGTGGLPGQISIGEDLMFQVTIARPASMQYARLAIRIFNSTGLRVTTCHSEYQLSQTIQFTGPTVLQCLMRNVRFAPGKYTIDLQLDEHRTCVDKIECCTGFEVVASDVYNTGRLMPIGTAVVFPEVEWKLGQ
jgi:lipopolysaccharide transport system ATP-binding protein